MFTTSKGSSNSDVQNKGQMLDPAQIRGEKAILDPFKERKLYFRIKEKKDAPPVFILTARGVEKIELSLSDSLDRAIEKIRSRTRIDKLSELAVRSAFQAWKEQESNRAERVARIARIQAEEVVLINLVRSVVESHINADMTEKTIAEKINSFSIEKELITKLSAIVSDEEK